jgi:hypothetical protein
MHIALPHKLSKDRALARIKTALIQHHKEIEQNAKINEESWEGDTLKFAVEVQGKNISGTLNVTDTEYVLDAKLPLLWRMFEGQIQKAVEAQVKGLQ